jgi:uncharacterized protein (TIGR03663 family)
MSASSRWISAGILLLALALRLAWLAVKPAHFDEGVNGYFVDQITHQGFYHYDPTNFHGPLHFYALFVSQTLFGRSIWALRAPIALVSTGCVGMMLAYRRFFDDRVCQLAALAMAISPGMVFYGRYSIHETWLLFFLLITAWGLLGLWQDGERRDLWAVALGTTGMILTKETWIIHALAFLLAAPCLYYFEKFSPSQPLPESGPGPERPEGGRKRKSAGAPSPFWPAGGFKFCWDDVGIAATVSVALIVFFYSGGFLDWSSLPGLWQAYAVWTHTGVGGQTGHEKDWWYWLQLMGRYELPALIGLAGGFALLWPRTNRAARYLAIYGLGVLIAYSIIKYKTPWCLISLIWPFLFVFGLAVVNVARVVDAPTTAAFTGVAFLFTLGVSLKLNFHDFTDENEPYVYVQTLPEIDALLHPLRKLAERDPQNYFITGHFIGTEQYPFCWLLADYPLVDFYSSDALPDDPDADFLLVDDSLVEKIEPKLHKSYLRMPMRIRGLSADSEVLYLDPEIFGAFLPKDTPRFTPAAESGDRKAETGEKTPPADKASHAATPTR